MDFRFYFLKEGTRVYEITELITLLRDHPNIEPPKDEKAYGKKEYLYHHKVLNFDAKFVISEKSVVPHLEKLNPKYYDVNFYVEFDVLLSNYAAEMILDIIEEIVKKFRFCFYNEALDDVQQFRRSLAIKTFNSWKKAYAEKNPAAVAEYNFLDPQAFTQVYSYLQKRKRIELTFDPNKTVITNYIFLHAEKIRSAYVAIKWDGEKPFILPPSVDILCYDDGKVKRYLPMAQIIIKAEKLFKPVDGYNDVFVLEAKSVKKLKKILTKDRFAPLHVQLELIPISNILDV